MTNPSPQAGTIGQSGIQPAAIKRRVDPILQELYAVKAALNAEAGYSVAKVIQRAKDSAAHYAALTAH
jgi:hypothetical protein